MYVYIKYIHIFNIYVYVKALWSWERYLTFLRLGLTCALRWEQHLPHPERCWEGWTVPVHPESCVCTGDAHRRLLFLSLFLILTPEAGRKDSIREALDCLHYSTGYIYFTSLITVKSLLSKGHVSNQMSYTQRLRMRTHLIAESKVNRLTAN